MDVAEGDGQLHRRSSSSASWLASWIEDIIAPDLSELTVRVRKKLNKAKRTVVPVYLYVMHEDPDGKDASTLMAIP